MAERLTRSSKPLARDFVEMPHALPHKVPCGHVAGMARDREARFALEKLRLDSPNDPLSDLVLDRENVRKREIVSLRPQVHANFGVDQLR